MRIQLEKQEQEKVLHLVPKVELKMFYLCKTYIPCGPLFDFIELYFVPIKGS